MKLQIFSLLLGMWCIAISPDALATRMTSRANGNWSSSSTWNAVSIGVISYSQPNAAIDTIIIQSGHTVTISSTVNYSGTLVVRGTLVFYQAPSGGGRLVMDNASRIFIRAGGLITSDGPGNSDGIHNYIQIGEYQLNGQDINDKIKSPDYIDINTIAGNGGCVFTNLCSPVMLPIELLYFRVQPDKGSLLVEWATTKEWDFSHYTLERSDNGKDFEEIYIVSGKGVSNDIKTYTFKDNQPNFGPNYYRLKATDADGTEAARSVIMAYAGMQAKFGVYPNPANQKTITLQYTGANEHTWLSIQNISGREIIRVQMPDTELTLPISVLPKGIYILNVNNQFEVKQVKLIVP